MKIRLEKSAVNISKLTGGKNEKPKWGALHEELIYYIDRKIKQIRVTKSRRVAYNN